MDVEFKILLAQHPITGMGDDFHFVAFNSLPSNFPSTITRLKAKKQSSAMAAPRATRSRPCKLNTLQQLPSPPPHLLPPVRVTLRQQVARKPRLGDRQVARRSILVRIPLLCILLPLLLLFLLRHSYHSEVYADSPVELSWFWS